MTDRPEPADVSDPTSLLGTWHLARVIEDHLLDEVSHLEGELTLTQEGPEVVAWEERATWHRPAGGIAVRRGLRVDRTADGWWVRFEDGRDFHPWRPGERVVHHCAPDTYRGTVSGTTERWTVVWEASGPAKDYRMTTTLTPLPGAEEGVSSS
jgi:hypothetical protein